MADIAGLINPYLPLPQGVMSEYHCGDDCGEHFDDCFSHFRDQILLAPGPWRGVLVHSFG